MPVKLTKSDLRTVASGAYAYGVAVAPDEYSRGYASGVEDLARLLSERDPAISDRLALILRSEDMAYALPPGAR